MARVLIADDETAVRQVIREALKVRAIESLEAADGYEATEVLARVKPDLMIVDILMPRMGGLQTIRLARERYPDLPVIAISGGGKDGKLNFLSTARAIPGVRTLQKPFRLAGLLDLVASSLPAEAMSGPRNPKGPDQGH